MIEPTLLILGKSSKYFLRSLEVWYREGVARKDTVRVFGKGALSRHFYHTRYPDWRDTDHVALNGPTEGRQTQTRYHLPFYSHHEVHSR